MLRKRLFALICAITFIFLSVLGRVFYVQIISGRELQEKAVDQWTRELPVKARRGVITDRNGLILAENKQSYAVFIRTRVVGDAERTAEKLSEILDVDKNALLKRINSDSSSEITVKRQVPREKNRRDFQGKSSRGVLLQRFRKILSLRRIARADNRVFVS